VKAATFRISKLFKSALTPQVWECIFIALQQIVVFIGKELEKLLPSLSLVRLLALVAKCGRTLSEKSTLQSRFRLITTGLPILFVAFFEFFSPLTSTFALPFANLSSKSALAMHTFRHSKALLAAFLPPVIPSLEQKERKLATGKLTAARPLNLFSLEHSTDESGDSA
jgi:hypothetical protein